MKRAELLPVSGSGLCDLSQTRLADYLADYCRRPRSAGD